eukprot:5181959-Karenia_brevis.AAC.1
MQLKLQLSEAERALGAWIAHCGSLEDALRCHGHEADLTFRMDVVEQRLDKVVQGTEKLKQSLGQAVQDSIDKRVSQWEASFLSVSNFEEKLDLLRNEIQKSLDALYQGFLSQLPGIFRDCADALLNPKGSVESHGLVTIEEEVESEHE